MSPVAIPLAPGGDGRRQVLISHAEEAKHGSQECTMGLLGKNVHNTVVNRSSAGAEAWKVLGAAMDTTSSDQRMAAEAETKRADRKERQEKLDRMKIEGSADDIQNALNELLVFYKSQPKSLFVKKSLKH